MVQEIKNIKMLNYEVKEQMVVLSGNCFWFWGGFHSFLSSCGVPRQLIVRYPKGAYSKYDVMRNILEDLERTGEFNVIQDIVSGFYRLMSPIDKDNLDVGKAKRLLSEFRALVGTDPIERAVDERQRKIRQEEARKSGEKTLAQRKKLERLKDRFLTMLSKDSSTPQQRGFDLEILIFELLESEEFEFSKPYRQPGEQIDGHFSYNKFDYLFEIKWVKNSVKQNDLSVLDGKIKGKAQSTRGFFLAINGFDENAIKKYSGDSPRIVLMDGQELINILEGRKTFFDLLKFKIDALVRYGDIFRKNL